MQKENFIIIKGMVCQRCIRIVKTAFEDAGIQPVAVNLGMVTIPGNHPLTLVQLLNEKLIPLGFHLLENKNARLVSDVKKLVAEVYSGSYDFPHHFRFSRLATLKLGLSYDFISNVFSVQTRTTIEKYIIAYRIKKVKELLGYSNNTLATIAFQLGFTSVAHLSGQFKDETGLNPSQFRAYEYKAGVIETGIDEN